VQPPVVWQIVCLSIDSSGNEDAIRYWKSVGRGGFRKRILAAGDLEMRQQIHARKMKTTEKQKIETGIALRGFRKLVRYLMAAAAYLEASHVQAHLTYGGRDFGAFSGLTNVTATISNQAVTGNYGWADAADGVLGDSHRARAFRFRLDKPAYVRLTVSANPTATTNSLGGFTPAFSLYSGLAAVAPFPPSQTTNAAAADHDGSAASLAWRIAWVKQNLEANATSEAPTDGCWNALSDMRIGGDGDLPGDFSQLSVLTYKGSAASTSSGGTVTGSFALPAGDYTILIGGNDLANKTSNTALSPHGIVATLSVSPTPFVSIVPKVFVAWPSGTNWVLESSASITAANWTIITRTPITVEGQRGVLLDGGGTPQYFRLRSIE
jgi:hypothetical protein